MATRRVSLKLLIDRINQTVVFAESGKDFVEFLLHLLTLPVGQVIQLLTNTRMVGGLGSLSGSIEKLNDVFIESSMKDILLKPKAPNFFSQLPFLLPEIPPSSDSTPKTDYGCSRSRYNSHRNGICFLHVAEESPANFPLSKLPMNEICILVESRARNPAAAVASAAKSDGKGSFVQGTVMYMVMDDLAVRPMSIISSITLLNQFNVKEIGHLEEKVVNLGMDEVFVHLKASESK
ncbi:uncharacterized protein LOC125316301 [Rhodamnia argentea]|uniref:Uncharacterized protein LOC125316301 n=1 Tax=Rhodamnia argentea TaxID=178133 RepID=A0ABM3HUJ1_9MYRT|nr:uncharacterized protein LOC125316301 [Rhodamnia argentea]